MAKTRSRGPRASWKGQLRVDLVSFSVAAFNAIGRETADVHLHQLHAECHSRIEHHKVCPIHGEVSNDDIVMGYEYRKGKYVEIDPEELDKLRTKADRALRIDTFIGPDELDPMYYDGRTYYLVPDGAEAREPYAVMCAALTKLERYGIGVVVFSEREQLVALRPVGDALIMSMLHHEAEFRQPDEVGIHKLKAPAKEIHLAEVLIKAATEEFDFANYVDRYRERLEQLIETKVKGHEVVAPEEPEEPEVINLMDALRKSVAKATGGRKTTKRKTAPKKRARRKKAS
ncbi:MAG TPA: Ku protein [Pirellulales bacterium]|jgi:DNA end-binding protein Ku|nr:Ku protein [Pirellulales bacterium]